MERRDSSLFPTLLSLFPSSFRLAQHSLWPTLPYMVNISAAVGVLIRSSSSLVEEPLGWLMRGKADVDSFDQGRTRRILTMPESSVHRAPTTTPPDIYHTKTSVPAAYSYAVSVYFHCPIIFLYLHMVCTLLPSVKSWGEEGRRWLDRNILHTPSL